VSRRPAYVYLLRCGDRSLYCGWTHDVERRLAQHRAGRAARYTRSRQPVELAWVVELPDARSARREEARIKRLTRPQKLALVASAGRAGSP
jgi:putative endonuclease